MRIALIVCVPLLLRGAAAGQGSHFQIRSDFGAESAWAGDLLEKAHAQMVRLMDNAKVEPPSGIAVEIKRNSGAGGVGGGATERSLTFTSDQFPKDKWRIWILVHELANLFVHHYAGAGGFPSDWWADGRSPVPVYIAALVAAKLGEKETAEWLKTVDQEKQDQRLVWRLHEKHGFEVFAKCFKLLRGDCIDLGRIGAPWPSADERRSAWTIAYLSIAAGSNLAPLFREHGIGSEPGDWKARHPERPFTAYAITDQRVDDLMALRAHLFGPGSRGRAIEILRESFRSGLTWTAGATQDPPAVVAKSPVAFRIESAFGNESDWTATYLDSAAAALLALFDDPELRLPPSVPIRLRKQPDAQGIGGGARADAIELVSDQWPKERFRLWILASELTGFFLRHVGGSVPDDWFGNEVKPFATFVSGLLLQKLGHAEESKWLRDMSRKPEYELFWKLHETYGFRVFSRAFALMRKEKADVSKLGAGTDNPQRVRTHHLIAYLSRAAGTNLAPLFREHRIGTSEKPPAGFRSYDIDDAEVERLMKAK